MAPPFEEDENSDVDSISITSTQPSDEENEYAVEKILWQEPDKKTGVMKYLIKWEGYPVALSTWEPAEHLLSDRILPDWEKEQEAIRAGAALPFDLDSYWEALELQSDEKEERRVRRAAKRKRLGLSTSRGGSVSGASATANGAGAALRGVVEDSEEDEPSPKRKKQVKTVVPKRKGMAQTVKKSLNRRVSTTASSDESSDGSQSDTGSTSEDSLMEESRVKVAPNGVSSKATSKPVKKSAVSTARGNASTAAASKVAQKRPSAQLASHAAASSSAQAGSANFAKRMLPSSSARKSAPSTASGNARLPTLPANAPKRRTAVEAFMNFGKTAPERRDRRMSESDPRQQRFKNLSEESRFRKHAAKEAAPDPSVLGTFNPATGRFDAPVAAAAAREPLASTTQISPIRNTSLDSGRPTQPTAAQSMAGAPPQSNASRVAGLSSVNVPSNLYGRREARAPARQRTVSPPASPGARTDLAPAADNTTPYMKVCWRWRNGVCHVDRCSFAHHYITCPHWKEGYCDREEGKCKFDHTLDGRDPILPSQGLTLNTPRFYPSHKAPILTTTGMSPIRGGAHLPEAAGMASIRPAPPGPPPPPPTMVRPSVPTIIKLNTMTCRLWYESRCPRNNFCKLSHHETGQLFEYKDITCLFWAKDKCNKSEDVCQYAHRHTRYAAGKPYSYDVLFMPDIADTAGTVNLAPSVDAFAQQALPQDARAREPGEILNNDPMVLDDIGAQGPVVPPANMTPISRRPSVSIQRPGGSSAFTRDVVFKVKCGSDDFEVAAKLACATEQDASFLAEILGSQHRLHMQHMVNATDLQDGFADTLEQGARFSTGDVIYEKARHPQFEKLAETYKLHVSCGVVQAPEFTLLVYPTGAEEWKFLTRAGDVTTSHAALKFKLLPPLPVKMPDPISLASDLVSDAAENTSSSLVATHLLDMDVERLLKISDTKTEERVFIMMPPSRDEELQLCVRIFEHRFQQADYKDRPTKVWTSQEAGRWDSLVKNSHGACLLIIHPEIPLWDIPHLAKILHYTSFRVFSVGIDPSLAALEQRPPAFGCQRLFPMADVVFVTDDIFLQTPEKVLRIIDEINRQNKDKPSGAPRNKIAARPGVRRWLMGIVAEERGREDPRWVRLLEAIWDLCPDDKSDPLCPGNPSEQADLVSIPPEQLPTFQALLLTDNKKATDYAVNWFAGWACMNASKFRRFTVCHEEPGTGEKVLDANYNMVIKGAEADPRGWARAFRYLLVRTPELWLKDKVKTKK